MVRPAAFDIRYRDFAFAPGHLRCTAISRHASVLNSFAAASTAASTSAASTVPSNLLLAAARYTSQRIGFGGGSGFLAITGKVSPASDVRSIGVPKRKGRPERPPLDCR